MGEQERTLSTELQQFAKNVTQTLRGADVKPLLSREEMEAKAGKIHKMALRYFLTKVKAAGL